MKLGIGVYVCCYLCFSYMTTQQCNFQVYLHSFKVSFGMNRSLGLLNINYFNISIANKKSTIETFQMSN